MSDSVITIDANEVMGNLKGLVKRVKAGLDVIGAATGQQMEVYAKQNARWTDRTGAARGGISFRNAWEGDVLNISVLHTVDYGLWLEVRDFPIAGKLAILKDARDSQVSAFLNAVKGLI